MAHISNLTLNDSSKLLCLNCRQLGHVVGDCTERLGQKFPEQR